MKITTKHFFLPLAVLSAVALPYGCAKNDIEGSEKTDATREASPTIWNLNDEATTRADAYNAVPQEFMEEAKNARFFALNPALKKETGAKVNDIVNLQLFEGDGYQATVSNIVTDVNGNYTLSLKLVGYPMGFGVITTSTEGKSLVTVSVPEKGRIYGSLLNAKSNEYYLLDKDNSKRKYIDFHDDAIEITNTDQNNASGNPHLNAVATRALGEDDPATIDLLIVYTPAAANSTYSAQRGGINNVISTMIALGNTAMELSKTSITLRLARSEQVDYTETDMNTSLSQLQGTTDGYMDNVHQLRTQYGADLVQLISSDAGGGLGYLINSSGGNYRYCFSVVNVTQVGGDYPCSVHELGHNMGLSHGANMLDYSVSKGLFSYSFGWDWIGNDGRRYTSVMGYWSPESYADNQRRYNTAYFSNPNVSHQGVPTGDAVKADAARSLRKIKHVVANYETIKEEPPVVFSGFTLNNGDKTALFHTAKLNLTISGGTPTHYMSSESSSFDGASWKVYDTSALTHTFDKDETGIKTVYVKLKNSRGETEVRSDEIYYKPAYPVN
ncbi:MAG: M12 family metallo-peptidase [Dysgonamonadaceae bacterium]|jgi:hypothetical protein|nr:M12 family metallo-peptidase [Dysgonamonadaceae bacterium]